MQMMIDCSKNWFLAALYLAAITFDAAAKEKVAISPPADDAMRLREHRPAEKPMAPYPSLEGVTDPLLLPICGTQIVLLTLGVLFRLAVDQKKKPAATQRTAALQAAFERRRRDDAAGCAATTVDDAPPPAAMIEHAPKFLSAVGT